MAKREAIKLEAYDENKRRSGYVVIAPLPWWRSHLSCCSVGIPWPTPFIYICTFVCISIMYVCKYVHASGRCIRLRVCLCCFPCVISWYVTHMLTCKWQKREILLYRLRAPSFSLNFKSQQGTCKMYWVRKFCSWNFVT